MEKKICAFAAQGSDSWLDMATNVKATPTEVISKKNGKSYWVIFYYISFNFFLFFFFFFVSQIFMIFVDFHRLYTKVPPPPPPQGHALFLLQKP